MVLHPSASGSSIGTSDCTCGSSQELHDIRQRIRDKGDALQHRLQQVQNDTERANARLHEIDIRSSRLAHDKLQLQRQGQELDRRVKKTEELIRASGEEERRIASQERALQDRRRDVGVLEQEWQKKRDDLRERETVNLQTRGALEDRRKHTQEQLRSLSESERCSLADQTALKEQRDGLRDRLAKARKAYQQLKQKAETQTQREKELDEECRALRTVEESQRAKLMTARERLADAERQLDQETEMEALNQRHMHLSHKQAELDDARRLRQDRTQRHGYWKMTLEGRMKALDECEQRVRHLQTAAEETQEREEEYTRRLSALQRREALLQKEQAQHDLRMQEMRRMIHAKETALRKLKTRTQAPITSSTPPAPQPLKPSYPHRAKSSERLTTKQASLRLSARPHFRPQPLPLPIPLPSLAHTSSPGIRSPPSPPSSGGQEQASDPSTARYPYSMIPKGAPKGLPPVGREGPADDPHGGSPTEKMPIPPRPHPYDSSSGASGVEAYEGASGDVDGVFEPLPSLLSPAKSSRGGEGEGDSTAGAEEERHGAG
ncbi:unnamed protein product [Vitrella brassicaformis CCMP3155]|uniref:Uncharacterized protein n=1 Tax=Vitrella brassicaformis (strain CCMP3155) TaxID=1169540 RepID=A0A0G4G3X2_VITBC|nr:unnamed protein product [Vitrella brassicaformis CCMP3155]|eukprot:CEM22778.1 unnamed protein product [Vitrella brassicaformis CCMP3155]